MQIKTLLGDKIMVLPEVTDERKTPSGIILIEKAKSTKESMQRGVVVLKGTGTTYKASEETIKLFNKSAEAIVNKLGIGRNTEDAVKVVVDQLIALDSLRHNVNLMDDVHVKREVCWKAGAGMWFDDVDDHGAPIKYLILNHSDLFLV